MRAALCRKAPKFPGRHGAPHHGTQGIVGDQVLVITDCKVGAVLLSHMAIIDLRQPAFENGDILAFEV